MNAPPAASSTLVPRWQMLLAGISLVIVSVVVFSPIATTLLSIWGLILGVASAWTLDVIGARQDPMLRNSVEVAITLLGFAGLGTLTGAAVVGVKKLGSRQTSKPAPPTPGIYYSPPIFTTPKRPSTIQHIARHPWLSLGGLILFVDGCVVPAHASGAVRFPPALLGGFVLAGAFLLFLSAVVLTGRGFWYGMRTIWGGVRRSAFFAGMVTTGSVLATLVTLVLGMAVAQAASALSAQETARTLQTCSGSAEDCTRKLLQSAVGPKPLQLAPAPNGDAFSNPEGKERFDQCVEELFRSDGKGQSLRSWAMEEAKRITGDEVEAEDLVHSAMLSVCLMDGNRIDEIRPYFVRSVQNAARRQWRRSRRWCPIVPEDPSWLPEACIQRSVEQQALQKEAEISANDALCGLSGDERLVVELHLWSNLSHAEIAPLLKCSPETARKRYSRALESLRSKFGERCR